MVTENKKKGVRFVGVGIILALFNFCIYTFLARIIFKTNDLLWLDSIIACILATILGYFMHSRITWKQKTVRKINIIKFFVWNLITALAISPFLTWAFGFLTPLYEFVFNIFSSINIPFDYAFVESTGIFCLTTVITTILNYLFYDKFVFPKPKEIKNEE